MADLMIINKIQQNKVSVAAKKNIKFKNQIDGQLLITEHFEGPSMNFGRVKKEFTSPSVDSTDTYNGHSFKFNVGQFTNEKANDTDEKVD